MGKYGPTKRDLQAEETRQRLLKTAIKMIEVHGFDNITVDDICRESKAAKGLFYHYFKSKDDIIIELYRAYDEMYVKKLSKFPSEMTSIQKLIFTYQKMAKTYQKTGPEYVRQIYKSQIYTGTKYFASESRPYYKLLYEIIAQGQKNKELRKDLSTRELTRMFMIFSRGIVYDWAIHQGDYDLQKAFKTYFSVLLTGIAAPQV